MAKYSDLLSLFTCLVLTTMTPSYGVDRRNGGSNLLRFMLSSQKSTILHRNTLPDVDVHHLEPQDGLKKLDKIDKLPGEPAGVDFDQYSGYVTVDEAAPKTLFYYFVESPHNSTTKPLVLWLNGGPGCSSIGSAFLELGPFRIKRDGKTLMLNPYSWHYAANMLFLDSPAGVGFSYGNETIVANQTGDISTTRDTYMFLIKWLERFPEYKNRDFYITGENYAGHYAPQLAYTILHYNNNASYPPINLKGLAIANAWIDDTINWAGLYDNMWRRDMCSKEGHDDMFRNCNFSDFIVSTHTKECNRSIYKVAEEIGLIDLFNIYAPLCNISTISDAIESGDVYDPCSLMYLDNYLGRRNVLRALHARPTSYWSQCWLFYVWQDRPTSMLPIIQQLTSTNLRIWLFSGLSTQVGRCSNVPKISRTFFSGDFDGYVPPLSTKNAIETLKLPIQTHWRPWYHNYQVGGYVLSYDGVTIVTIREAGHEIASHQSERALTAFSSFLQGTLPPTSS